MSLKGMRSPPRKDPERALVGEASLGAEVRDPPSPLQRLDALKSPEDPSSMDLVMALRARPRAC
jgi:hypothetical protein